MPVKCCSSKFKKAQHLVELALIAPFVIIFIGLISEIAVVVHTNYKFNSSIYEAISSVSVINKINTEKEETIDTIEEITKILLKGRMAPYKDSVKIKLVETKDIDFLIGEYTYTSTFTILNSFKDFTPSSYKFLTVIPVNSSILRNNSFNIKDEFFENDFYQRNETLPHPDETTEDKTGESEDSFKDEESPESTNEEDKFDIEETEANLLWKLPQKLIQKNLKAQSFLL